MFASVKLHVRHTARSAGTSSFLRLLFPLTLVAGLGPLATGCRPAESPELSGWQIQFADTTAVIVAMSAIDPLTAWASGDGGFVLRTVNAGKTWEQYTVLDTLVRDYRDVHAFSRTEAVAVSIPRPERGIPGSAIFATADSGSTWRETLSHPAFLSCMDFWDNGYGFVAGDSYLRGDGEREIPILRTEDRGISWSAVPHDAKPVALYTAESGLSEGGYAASGTCAVARGEGLGWYGTTHSRVLRTADYGMTWTPFDTPIPDGIFSLVFVDDTTGFAFGRGDSTSRVNVAQTQDGGLTWSALAEDVLGGHIFGAAALSREHLVVVHPSASALSTDGGLTWRNIPSKDLWTVTFASPDAGWAGGRGGLDRARFVRR